MTAVASAPGIAGSPVCRVYPAAGHHGQRHPELADTGVEHARLPSWLWLLTSDGSVGWEGSTEPTGRRCCRPVGSTAGSCRSTRAVGLEVTADGRCEQHRGE